LHLGGSLPSGDYNAPEPVPGTSQEMDTYEAYGYEVTHSDGRMQLDSPLFNYQLQLNFTFNTELGIHHTRGFGGSPSSGGYTWRNEPFGGYGYGYDRYYLGGTPPPWPGTWASCPNFDMGAKGSKGNYGISYTMHTAGSYPSETSGFAYYQGQWSVVSQILQHQYPTRDSLNVQVIENGAIAGGVCTTHSDPQAHSFYVMLFAEKLFQYKAHYNYTPPTNNSVSLAAYLEWVESPADWVMTDYKYWKTGLPHDADLQTFLIDRLHSGPGETDPNDLRKAGSQHTGYLLTMPRYQSGYLYTPWRKWDDPRTELINGETFEYGNNGNEWYDAFEMTWVAKCAVAYKETGGLFGRGVTDGTQALIDELLAGLKLGNADLEQAVIDLLDTQFNPANNCELFDRKKDPSNYGYSECKIPFKIEVVEFQDGWQNGLPPEE